MARPVQTNRFRGPAVVVEEMPRQRHRLSVLKPASLMGKTISDNRNVSSAADAGSTRGPAVLPDLEIDSSASGTPHPSAEAVAQAIHAWTLARTQAKRTLLPPGTPCEQAVAPAKPARFPFASPRPIDPSYVPLPPDPVPAPLVAEIPFVGVLRRWRNQLTGQTVACAAILLAALLIVGHEGVTFLMDTSLPRDCKPVNYPAWDLLSSKEWFQRAQGRADDGDFRLALGTVKYALASGPGDAALLNFEGNMYQSLFQFQDARMAYESALRLDAGNKETRQNLLLCRRLGRDRSDPATRASTLYGLHRVMLDQKRISEAIAISRRFPADRALQQSTWQAALEQTGLLGRITVDADGGLSLDLSGILQPDLARIREFPVRRLNLANTGLEDIRALAGMPLQELDLANTLVHDLSPLTKAPLRRLVIRGTGVVELFALARCPLQELDISGTHIADLAPLAKTPLHVLRAAGTPVSDLTPLAAVPLVSLDLSRTRVRELQALSSLGLRVLNLNETGVTDLSALRGCPLEELSLAQTGVHDLTPLWKMPVRVVSLAGCAAALDLRPLASCEELEHLLVPLHPLHLDALQGLAHLRFTQS